MKNILTAALILLSVSLFSQDRREMIDGEEFIIHTVKQNETLYGITKKYNVSKKDLRSSNAGLLLFIKTDQEIRVPVPVEERTIHIVKKGETLYGIAKQYKLTMEQLVLLNPKKAISLQVGDQLILKKNAKAPVYEKVKVNGHEKTQPEIESKPEIEKATEVKEKVEAKRVEFTKGNGDIHTVEKGETLYAIARKYNLSVTQLLELNPQINDNLISIGDKLNIPTQKVEEKSPELVPNNTTKQVEYKVEKGETLYGISKKFNTTVEEITKINPSITSLKEGDVLKINVPKKGVEEIKIDLGNPNSTDSVDFDKVNKINPLKEKLNDMVKKDSYTISMFLPLMLDQNDRTPVEPNKPKKINPLTEMSTHFYQGAMMAFDTVKTSGVSIDLNVYDSEKDTNTIGKLLRTQKVKSSDLQTSLPTQLNHLAHYIANNRNTENVICVSGKTKKDKYLSAMFADSYNQYIGNKTNNYRSKVNEYNMTSFSSMSGFDTKLVKGKKNIIVIPFTEEGMASSFFTQLNIMMTRSRMKGYEVEVYALENFMEYDNINVDLKMKYNLHVTSSSFIDYKDENVKSFVKNYRAKYGTEPTKYAFVGYDVAFYHAIAMSNYGRNFSAYYGQIQVPLLQSTYQLKRTDDTSGFENQAVFILQYKEYELVKVN